MLVDGRKCEDRVNFERIRNEKEFQFLFDQHISGCGTGRICISCICIVTTDQTRCPSRTASVGGRALSLPPRSNAPRLYILCNVHPPPMCKVKCNGQCAISILCNWADYQMCNLIISTLFTVEKIFIKYHCRVLLWSKFWLSQTINPEAAGFIEGCWAVPVGSQTGSQALTVTLLLIP